MKYYSTQEVAKLTGLSVTPIREVVKRIPKGFLKDGYKSTVLFTKDSFAVTYMGVEDYNFQDYTRGKIDKWLEDTKGKAYQKLPFGGGLIAEHVKEESSTFTNNDSLVKTLKDDVQRLTIRKRQLEDYVRAQRGALQALRASEREADKEIARLRKLVKSNTRKWWQVWK